MSAAKEIFFHVGAHKTGTSLVQNSLAASSEALAATGTAYVHKYELGQTALYRRLLQRTGKEAGETVEPDSARASLQQIVDRSEQRRVLLSHENLMGATGLTSSLQGGRLYPYARILAEELAAASRGFPLTIIVSIRNQPDFVESMYLQSVMTGRDRSFRAHRRKVAFDQLRWDRLLDELAGVVGPERLVVVPFERIYKTGPGGFVRYFLESAGLPVPDPLEVSADQNRSFSATALQVALRAYPVLDGDQRRRLSRFLRKHFDNRDSPRPRLLSGRQRARVLRRLEAGNSAVFERYVRGSSAKVRAYYQPVDVAWRDDERLDEIRQRVRKGYRHVANRLRGRR